MRTLYEIAAEVRADWKKVYFGAVPYLEAMETMTDINQQYIFDPGTEIVMYFLANANTWRGETARRVKAELKSMLAAVKR
jgi:hypothetical protein